MKRALKNNGIPDSISKWCVDYGQSGFLKDKDWLKKSELTEDILQLSHIYADGLILDVGFYTDRFIIYIIYGEDWENPKEVFESHDQNLVSEKVYEFIDKYSNG